MPRWEERKKERDAATKRSRTPYVAPEPAEAKGLDLRRGGGVRNRGKYELPNFLQPSAISTPARGGTAGRGIRQTVKSKDEESAAPAQPALDPNGSNGSRGENRTGVTPVNGSFRTAVEQQQSPQSKSEKPGARTNANGLVSYGKDLSSLNKFTSAFTGGYELTDIKSAFQSNDLNGAYQNGSNTISTEDSKYTLPDGATPSNVGGKYTMDGVDTALSNTGYQISDKSVPGTVGGNSNDPQDGTSSKPDVAESIRTVRMERQAGRGSRRDPRNRGEDPDMFGGPEPSDASLVSPMYKNAKRNKIRSTFLDHEGNSIQAVAAANAVAGYGKDSNGSPQFNYGGELIGAKEGMAYKAKNAAMMGEDPSQYLDIPTAGDIQPDTPAASELTTNLVSGVKPGAITAPENTGGSLETTAPLITPSPEKFKQAQDFMSGKMDMLTRKTR